MSNVLLRVNGLSVSADTKPLLHDVNLQVDQGQINVLMGPNGAGKTTLGQVIMGSPAFSVDAGSIEFNGKDITELEVDKRSRAGLFMTFQAPVEVPGVPLNSFLRAIAAQHDHLDLKGKRYKARVAEIIEQLELPESVLNRELNVGFSGGERKKIEMLQLLLLKPRLAILDETDSGLDVDALSVVSRAINAYREECDGTILIITHNTRILEHLSVDKVHVMVGGSVVAEGSAELIAKIDAEGFEQFGHVEAPEEVEAEPAMRDQAIGQFDVSAALAGAEQALREAEADSSAEGE